MDKNDKMALDLRDGLPPELRVLADLYPRDTWRGHPNFNQLTAFWLDRHLMFRDVLSKITSNTQGFLDGAEQPRFGPELARYTGFLLRELHGHHSIEDHHYFPRFQSFDPRLTRAFDLLDGDHHALDFHMNALAEASNALLGPLSQRQPERGKTQDAAGKLLSVQQGFETFLNRHLLDEEEVIVPIVLEYGAEID